MLFSFIARRLRARRILSVRRRKLIWDEIHRKATERTGPPAVSLARAAFGGRSDIRIDPLETEFQLDAAGAAVRAWVLLPTESIPEPAWPELARSARNARLLDPIDARIFFLALSYGLRQSEIAVLLGLHRVRIRRAVSRSIMRADRSAR